MDGRPQCLCGRYVQEYGMLCAANCTFGRNYVSEHVLQNRQGSDKIMSRIQRSIDEITNADTTKCAGADIREVEIKASTLVSRIQEKAEMQSKDIMLT